MSGSITSSFYLEAAKALLLLLLLAALFARPRAGAANFRRLSRAFRALAARPGWAMLAVGALPVALRLALLPINPPPEPAIHDEFAQLLLAETFASGRVTNPAHPHAVSFESVYILSRPTYTAQYQVAIGLVLAAGERLAGHPWAAVVASMGLLCAALYWMLRGWLPSYWAVLGSTMAALHIGVFEYWMNSYWGGTVPAIGGTLALGALARLHRGRSLVAYSALLALGLAIVMNSRPLEAFLLGLVVLGSLIWWVIRTREPAPLRTATAAQVVLPLGVLLMLTLSGMAWYNWRVTGNALELPYMLHQKVYGTPQPFWWQRPITVARFPNKEIEDDYLRQRMLHDRRTSPVLMLKSIASRAASVWVFFLGVSLGVPLLFLRSAWHDRPVRFALLAGIPFLLDHLTFHAFYPHYAAPEMGLLLLVSIQCWRHMRVWRWNGRPAGLALSRALPLVAAFGLALPVAGKVAEPLLPTSLAPASRLWVDLFPRRLDRPRIARQLEAMGGRHLVLVRYRHPGHHPDNEWVRNGADIDGSNVVWARELDAETNSSLIAYYRDRRVWLVEPDVHPITLKPYSGTSGEGLQRIASGPQEAPQ